MNNDPMEELIVGGLNAGGFRYVREDAPEARHLDFFLWDHDIHIEVKRLHSDRIAAQMARAPNVIVAQGKPAVEMLARLLANGGGIA